MLEVPTDDRRLFAHPGVDAPTLLLLAGMWGLLGANLYWALPVLADPSAAQATWWARLLLHFGLAVLGLNASFTVWHEAAHGTIFRARWANEIAGVLGAFPALLPYFGIRRVHLLHHAHTNDRERDPDVWFLQGSIWTLPLRYLAGVRRAQRMLRELRPPVWERLLDRAQTLLALTLMAWALGQGWWLALLVCWVAPKLLAMWIHAWYVNWLPHRNLPAERWRDTRIFDQPWLQPLFLCHNYHGLHHGWQTVPWHRYRRAFEAKRALLIERGAPIERLGRHT